jgi:hypothetical protein
LRPVVGAQCNLQGNAQDAQLVLLSYWGDCTAKWDWISFLFLLSSAESLRSFFEAECYLRGLTTILLMFDCVGLLGLHLQALLRV